MRTEEGVFVLNSKKMGKSKFEGIIVSKIDENQKRNGILAQKGFYDAERGELNVSSLRKILIGIVESMKPRETKIPKIAVTEDVMKLLK